ncbi:MAG: hypothetical protein J6U68_03075 [Clostridia bacterium]|nr:hypothetical protein [Clostridia bacterium]
MKRYARISALLLVILMLFCSCKNEKKTCEEILVAGLEYGIDGYADSGYFYLKSADEGSAFFLTEKKMKLLYGERFFDTISSLKDFAIYTFATAPYEISIFECYSSADTYDALEACYERADELKVAMRFGKWEEASKGIAVAVYKKYVILAFTDSPQRSEETVEAIISSLN